MGRKRLDVAMKKFGSWQVTNESCMDKHRKLEWKCICVCGNIGWVPASLLSTGGSTGCQKCGWKKGALKLITHGLSKIPEYCVWLEMNKRCRVENHPEYANYGGRGIKVCARWKDNNLDGMTNFIEDLGRRPSKKHWIERIDNNKGYEPLNCKWALPSEQIYNRRKYKAIENFSNEELLREIKRRGFKIEGEAQ